MNATTLESIHKQFEKSLEVDAINAKETEIFEEGLATFANIHGSVRERFKDIPLSISLFSTLFNANEHRFKLDQVSSGNDFKLRQMKKWSVYWRRKSLNHKYNFNWNAHKGLINKNISRRRTKNSINNDKIYDSNSEQSDAVDYLLLILMTLFTRLRFHYIVSNALACVRMHQRASSKHLLLLRQWTCRFVCENVSESQKNISTNESAGQWTMTVHCAFL